MVRAMCGQKVVDRRTTEKQMNMLGLKETIGRLAKANGVRWYELVLRRNDDSVLRVALNLEVTGKRKRGRLNQRDGVVVRESASQSVDLGFIP